MNTNIAVPLNQNYPLWGVLTLLVLTLVIVFFPVIMRIDGKIQRRIWLWKKRNTKRHNN